jgi:hypothetical protein
MAKERMTEVSASRFSSAFLGKVAPAGRKVQGSSRPEIRATSTKDKFVLNEKARILMGVEPGSKVVMLDNNLYKAPEDRISNDKRFFIAACPEGYTENALLGDTNAFSYSGVWSAILMNDPQITEASSDDMVRAGLGIKRGKQGKNYVGTKIAAMELVKYTEEVDGEILDTFEIVPGFPAVPVFELTNIEFKNHDPKKTEAEELGE